MLRRLFLFLLLLFCSFASGVADEWGTFKIGIHSFVLTLWNNGWKGSIY